MRKSQANRCLSALLIFLCSSVVLLPRNADAVTLNAYAFLTVDGVALEGDPTIDTIGGEDVSTAIECPSAVYELYVGPRGAVARTPVTIRKRVDKSSPLLAKALAQNQRVDGEIRFYQSDADTGLTARSYTLTITIGKVSAIRSWLPDRSDAETTDLPMLEEVSVVYQSLTVTDAASGTSYVISVP